MSAIKDIHFVLKMQFLYIYQNFITEEPSGQKTAGPHFLLFFTLSDILFDHFYPDVAYLWSSSQGYGAN